MDKLEAELLNWLEHEVERPRCAKRCQQIKQTVTHLRQSQLSARLDLQTEHCEISLQQDLWNLAITLKVNGKLLTLSEQSLKDLKTALQQDYQVHWIL